MLSQELMAATLLLENMLPPERLRPHWRICNMPAPSPSNAGQSSHQLTVSTSLYLWLPLEALEFCLVGSCVCKLLHVLW